MERVNWMERMNECAIRVDNGFGIEPYHLVPMGSVFKSGLDQHYPGDYDECTHVLMYVSCEEDDLEIVVVPVLEDGTNECDTPIYVLFYREDAYANEIAEAMM